MVTDPGAGPEFGGSGQRAQPGRSVQFEHGVRRSGGREGGERQRLERREQDSAGAFVQPCQVRGLSFPFHSEEIEARLLICLFQDLNSYLIIGTAGLRVILSLKDLPCLWCHPDFI